VRPGKNARVRAAAAALLRKARIAVTPAELEAMEVADMGLGDVRHVGLELIVYENNDRYCAKELILLPRQMCPEHRHPRLDGRREHAPRPVAATESAPPLRPGSCGAESCRPPA